MTACRGGRRSRFSIDACLAPGCARERPCTIVPDNYSAHRTRAVCRATSAPAQGGVEFHFLPAYSPELSHIEPLCRLVKHDSPTQRNFTTMLGIP